MRQIFTSSYRPIFLLGLLAFCLTAFFSEGYYHPDEHFQILEFANYKWGRTPAADLPWEFTAQIRPALQPSIAYIFFRVLSATGLTDPFAHTLVLRLITAGLTWFVLCKWCLHLVPQFSSVIARRLFLLSTFFLWFMPVISVRFSSENYSGLLLLSAVYGIIKYDGHTNRQWYALALSGLLLGFAFYFRFQAGFAIVGLGMWLLFVKRLKWKMLLWLTLFGLVAAIACTAVDYWFYGEWVCTPLNYFESNIVDNKAANWGVHPWWYYFQLLILQGVPLVSLPLLVLFFTGLYKHRFSFFAWCIIPFLLAHFAVGHKELRFLFPLVFPFVYLAGRGLDDLMSAGKGARVLRIAVTVAAIVNMPLLAVKMFTPAQEVVPYYKYLYRHAGAPGDTVFTIEKDPYDILDLQVNFYRPPHLQTIVMADEQQFLEYLAAERPPSLLLLERKVRTDNGFSGYRSRSVYCLLPPWMLRFNFNNWVGRSRIWNIQELQRINQR